MRDQAKKCGELSNEETNINWDYGKNRYQNTSEENKEKLKEYQKNYREAKKSTWIFFYLFFFTSYKIEQKVWYFGKEIVVKSLFHKY